jgi:TPR repeat protein
MPNLIGLGAGASAGALAAALGLAFWPQLENAALPGKSMVSQPVFVAGAPPAKARPVAEPSAPIVATQVTTVAVDDDATAKAKLAMALQANPQKPPIAVGPVATRSMAPAASAPPVSESARRLCAQGLVALAAGDIVGARLYLERAAESGDVRALMVLGETYDPASLARMGVLGLKGDAARARDYYARALAAGMGDARERMAALEAP